ncbi:MAG TPA: hypothetical protein VGG05_10245 [Pseudonocardiaceae bacterium]
MVRTISASRVVTASAPAGSRWAMASSEPPGTSSTMARLSSTPSSFGTRTPIPDSVWWAAWNRASPPAWPKGSAAAVSAAGQ